MRNTVFLILAVLIFCFGCKDFDDELNVQIRVENSTTTKLSKVSIDDLIYTNVDADSKTAYQVKDDFLPPSQLTVDTDSLTLSVSLDNMQQDTLQPGRYTYKINTFSEADGLQFELLEN